jgi:hypothetical protein
MGLVNQLALDIVCNAQWRVSPARAQQFRSLRRQLVEPDAEEDMRAISRAVYEAIVVIVDGPTGFLPWP